MRLTRLVVLLLVTAPLLQGCALRQGKLSTAYRREILESWVGQSASDFVRKWGPPDSTFKNPDGTVVYTYEETTKVTRVTSDSWFHGKGNVGFGGGTARIDPAGRRLCRNLVEVEGDTVVRATFQGDRCSMFGTPFLGVNGTPSEDGLLLTVVLEEGSGFTAGLAEGMILQEIDDRDIRSPADIVAMLARHHAGDEVRMKYRLANGETVRKVILLQTRGGTAR